jgi:hypothetical protein
MEECGMDSVFRIVKTLNPTEEVYFLQDWGAADKSDIEDWVRLLKKGLSKEGKDDGTPCDYDLNNLQWSSQAILSSLDLQLWSEIEKEVSFDATGPEVLIAVIERKQQVNSSSIRHLVDKLKGLHIAKEPGQDVETFADKVVELARRIEGTGGAPSDLATLVAGTFLGSDSRQFDLEAIIQHKAADRPRSKVTWESLVR